MFLSSLPLRSCNRPKPLGVFLTWSRLCSSHWDLDRGDWLNLDHWRLGHHGMYHWRRGSHGHHGSIVTPTASDSDTIDHGDTVPAEGGDTLHHVD